MQALGSASSLEADSWTEMQAVSVVCHDSRLLGWGPHGIEFQGSSTPAWVGTSRSHEEEELQRLSMIGTMSCSEIQT
jgi:hypothetical protein